MTDDLAETLRALLRPGAPPNAVLDRLIAAYADYHLVLAAVGAAFAVLLLAVAVVCATRSRAAGRPGRRVLLGLALAGGVVAALLGVVAAANLGTGLHPRPGFASSVPLLGTPSPGGTRDQLQQAFADWLRAGGGPEPAPVQEAVARRLAWQRPKAVVCTVLLVVLAGATVRAWAAVVRGDGSRRGLGRGAALASTGACLVLVLMVMGNTQAALVPLAMTLFYG